MPLPAGNGRLEGKPAIDHPTRLARLTIEGPIARLDTRKCRIKHVSNGCTTLHRLEVPGERDQITPVALFRKHAGRCAAIAPRQCGSKGGQPGGRSLRWCACTLTHVLLLRLIMIPTPNDKPNPHTNLYVGDHYHQASHA